MVHSLRDSGSISGPPLRADSWSPFYKKCSFKRFLLQEFETGVQRFRCFLVFWLKSRFENGDGSHPLFNFLVVVVVGGCWYKILRKWVAKIQ